MSRSVKSLFAFLTGLVSGTLFGMLYAPDKGSSTRDKLTFKLDKYRGKLQELLDALIEGKNSHSSEAKSEGQKVITDAKLKAEKLLEDVDDLIGQIKGKQ
ncbi:MAG: YtxH domain-containing protein [Candidatus Cyclobacteriaceae bacterium M3_2C_046]